MTQQTKQNDYDFSGIWRSTFCYTSSTRDNKEFETEHYSIIHEKDNQIVIESLPSTDSYRITRLTLDGRIATGTWEQQNAKEGYYEGARYWGAIQLIVDEDGNAMRGKWIGFGSNMKVKSGPWEIVRVGKHLPSAVKTSKK
ncbi:MAG TPA: hypothetical protein VJ836_01075 [Candidatus Saccharimonadales bacterium]|nr:hypothetical protein [Candidatus Saccharimonadales bacterium]